MKVLVANKDEIYQRVKNKTVLFDNKKVLPVLFSVASGAAVAFAVVMSGGTAAILAAGMAMSDIYCYRGCCYRHVCCYYFGI